MILQKTLLIPRSSGRALPEVVVGLTGLSGYISVCGFGI